MLQFGSFPMWELISCRKFSSVPLVVWCKFVCDCWSYPLTPLWLTPVWMSPVYSLSKTDLPICYSLLDQENLRRHCTSLCPWLWDKGLSCSSEHQTWLSTNVQTKNNQYNNNGVQFRSFFPIFVIHLQLTAPFLRALYWRITHIFRRQCFKSHVS